MFEEIRNHNQAVAAQIIKGFTTDIEKAHNVGDVKVINGKNYVYTEYAPGKYDWHISDSKQKKMSSKEFFSVVEKFNAQQNKDEGKIIIQNNLNSEGDSSVPPYIKVYGTRKNVISILNKFNKFSGMNISVDDLKRDFEWGDNKYKGYLNVSDGKFYKEISDFPKVESKKTSSSKKRSIFDKVNIQELSDVLNGSISVDDVDGLSDKDKKNLKDLISHGVKMGKTFDWKEEEEVDKYKKQASKRGVRVVDIGRGTDTYVFVEIKK